MNTLFLIIIVVSVIGTTVAGFIYQAWSPKPCDGLRRWHAWEYDKGIDRYRCTRCRKAVFE